MADKHHFSHLSITISDKDPNRPAKHSQGTCYLSVVHEIVDFFTLDVCSKPIFCSKLFRKTEIA